MAKQTKNAFDFAHDYHAYSLSSTESGYPEVEATKTNTAPSGSSSSCRRIPASGSAMNSVGSMPLSVASDTGHATIISATELTSVAASRKFRNPKSATRNELRLE